MFMLRSNRALSTQVCRICKQNLNDHAAKQQNNVNKQAAETVKKLNDHIAKLRQLAVCTIAYKVQGIIQPSTVHKQFAK